MREIKFRAWSKIRKEMLYPATKFKPRVLDKNLMIVTELIGNTTEYSDNIILWKGFEIMQFTGLKDKNGKEIYEGDIVEEVNESGRKTYKIIWEKYNCSFLFEPVNFKANIKPNMGSIYTEVKRIGNIYENPELLK